MGNYCVKENKPTIQSARLLNDREGYPLLCGGDNQLWLYYSKKAYKVFRLFDDKSSQQCCPEEILPQFNYDNDRDSHYHIHTFDLDEKFLIVFYLREKTLCGVLLKVDKQKFEVLCVCDVPPLDLTFNEVLCQAIGIKAIEIAKSKLHFEEVKLENCTIDNTLLFSLSNKIIFAKVLDVYDGDTITVAFKFENNFYKEKCRLLGIDAPEIRTKNKEEKSKGLDSKKFLTDLILNKIVTIKCGNWDKYGRLLGEVYLDDKNINNLLLETNNALVYTK